MDPISAMLLAALVTWGTAGGGIKDTSAILKGQTPPSVAYRTARLASDEKRWRAWEKAVASGQPLPAALEPRRIRIKDLARHWWEDALADADAWRAQRHKSRPERKAARKARKSEKESLIKKGYDLIKARGEQRFGHEEGPEAEDTSTSREEEKAPAPEAEEAGALPDNVVPLRRNNEDASEPADEASPEPAKHPVIDGDRPLFEGANKEELAELTQSLARYIEDRDERDRALARELVTSLRTDTTTEVPVIDLSDAETLDAHLAALASYATYLERIAADMDSLAAGMASHAMGAIAVSEVSAAGAANSEAAGQCRAVREDLEHAHTVVADARAATPEAADGDYLTRGR